MLTAGLDWESRNRYAEAAANLERLVRDVEAGGGRYLALLHFLKFSPVAEQRLLGGLRDEQKAYLADALHEARELRVSSIDPHWNPMGHAAVAGVLYSVIRERDLLPQLELAPWPEAEAARDRWERPGRVEAQGGTEPADLLPADRVLVSEIEFPNPTPYAAGQVHGGIMPGGYVEPFAALLLAGPGSTLVVEGGVPSRPELRHAEVVVSVDGEELGRRLCEPGSALRWEFPLAAPLPAGQCVSVRLHSTDYAYFGENLRRSSAVRLTRISVR